MAQVVLAGGCFWCLDSVFRRVRGVTDVVSGYTGGVTEHPTYQQVCTGATGHAEAVLVRYDADQVSLDQLLDVFFTMHDPTTLNRQGADVGTQYRSALFFADDDQRAAFERAIVRSGQLWTQPIVTTLEPLGAFYDAEEYHQDFFAKNPTQGYCQAVVPPKIAKVRAKNADLLRD